LVVYHWDRTADESTVACIGYRQLDKERK